MKTQDLITTIATNIAEAFERGTLPWVREFDKDGSAVLSDIPTNFSTKKAYRGCNIIALWMSAIANGYTSSEWMTFKQAKALGGHVRKGEKSSTIVRWVVKDTDEEGNLLPDDQVTMFPVCFAVFNLDQIDGIEQPKTEAKAHSWSIEERAEAIIAKSKAVIKYEGNQPCYVPSTDEIKMPRRDQFHSAGAFYDTVLHELAHWTGHKSRLNRKTIGTFGTADYAFEELRAEIASMMICSTLGISHNVENQYSYLKAWAKKLKDDPKEIMRACQDAGKIHDYLMNI